MTPEEFSGFYRQSPTFRPDLSFLALDRGTVVSFCLCEVDDEDNQEPQTNDAYIQRVGTIRSHRGQRLATHLIVRAMEAASAGGFGRSALQVDEMSHTNATLVYVGLGFEAYVPLAHLHKGSLTADSTACRLTPDSPLRLIAPLPNLIL